MSIEPETTFFRIVLRLYETGLHYLGFVILALSGGVTRYVSDYRAGTTKTFKWVPLLMDLLISAFAGIIVALIGISYEMDPPLIAALCGIAGHLGARGIFLLQAMLLKKLRNFLGETNGNN